jgi:hypothetical protein
MICPTMAGKAAGSSGGGNLRGAELLADVENNVEWLICSYGELEMLEKDDNLEPDLGTATQSGSSVGWKGFEGRLGLRTAVVLSRAPLEGCGGPTVDFAILPFSSHHLCWSELAGGRPGSTGSYPIKSSSSSESSSSKVLVVWPTSAFRRWYSCLLIFSLTSSSTIFTVHWNVAYTGRWSENLSGAEL